ncbi:MAG: hypothetical protein ACRC92_00440 [Peptostreptococcaceae bacterium]
MQEKINLYKDVTVKIIEMLSKQGYDEVDDLIQQRQCIINEVNINGNVEEFKFLYKKDNINVLDKDIRCIMEKQLSDIKREIKEYKTKQQGNSTYAIIKKENLNIFSKKV